MINGTVKSFRNGYGFIDGSDGLSYFIHQSQIKMDGFRTLREGQTVSFEAMENEKGPTAVNLVPGEIPEQPKSFRDEIIQKEA